MSRIVVIGGGISGLACARGIMDRVPAAEVTVLEASPQGGGPVRSEQAEGFLCEAGPHGFLNSDPSTLALVRRLGLEHRLLPADEAHRGRFIFSGGRLHAFPDGPGRFLTSDLISPWGRARVLLEPFLRSDPPDGDESVGSFTRRRLGHEITERLVDPLIGGIYGGDVDRLSLAAAAPQLAALASSGKSLVLGALRLDRARPESSSGPPASPDNIGAASPTNGAAVNPPADPPRIPIGRRLVSFVGGTGEIVAALTGSLGPALESASPVMGVQRDGGRWRIAVGGAQPKEIIANAVVAAVPAPAAQTLFGNLDADLDRALASIAYLPAVMVALGFRGEDVTHDLNGFGYLVPRVEGGSVLGVLWSSSMFPGQRSPKGAVLVQAILGGAGQADLCDLPDARLEEQVCAQLRLAIGLRGAPLLRRIYRHRPGLPQYEVGHQQRVARVAAAEARLPGLFITGNALRGVGINACTADAERVVARVLASLD